MVFQPMTIREISATGAQIETTFPLQLNSLHDLRLELGDAAVVVKGRVVHCHIDEVESETIVYHTGIEFVDMPEWVAKAVAEFVDAVKTGRQG